MKTFTMWDPNLGNLPFNAALLAAVMGSVVIAGLTGTGAATIPAASISGGAVARSGQTAAVTDTTDTAALLAAASPTFKGGAPSAFVFTYINNGTFPITVAGGTGVTISGQNIVPANAVVQYLATYNVDGTVTMVAVMQSFFTKRGTFVANGATPVVIADARVTAGSQINITLKTVGGTVSPSCPTPVTITPGTGFNVAGIVGDTSTYNYEIEG
jgi:hypothetical protein